MLRAASRLSWPSDTQARLWPQDRSLELLKAWCELEAHSMVLDTVYEPLLDDAIGRDRAIFLRSPARAIVKWGRRSESCLC